MEKLTDNHKKVIYVDMDDTICNYSGERDHCLKTTPGIQYPQSQYGFYRNLRPIPGALEALRELVGMGYEVNIATKPSCLNPLSYTEKVEWVRYHLGNEWVEKLYITPDKSKLIGDYLIDDMLWTGFTGEQILFDDDVWTWEHILMRLNIEINL